MKVPNKQAVEKKVSKTKSSKPVSQLGPITLSNPPSDETVVPLIEAWFIEVIDSRGSFLLNSECSIQHLLLFLKERYLAGDFLGEEVLLFSEDLIQKPSSSSPGEMSRKSMRASIAQQARQSFSIPEKTYWFLDLVCENGIPLELFNLSRRDSLKNYVKGRGIYYLCKIKKGYRGPTKEIYPLLHEVPAELSEKIDQYLKSFDRPKKRENVKERKDKRDVRRGSERSPNLSTSKSGRLNVKKASVGSMKMTHSSESLKAPSRNEKSSKKNK